MEILYINHWYILGINNCQIFGRRVDELTCKWVDIYHFEDDSNMKKVKIILIVFFKFKTFNR